MSGINGSMAHLSDTLFVTSIATYALAAVGFTAEYSFGRRELRAGSKVVRARELVGAGGPPVTSSADTTTVPTVTPPTTPTQSGPQRRSFAERMGRAAVVIVVLGALIHAGSIAIRGIAVDAVPWSNMYEFANVAGLVGVVAFLALMWKAPSIRRLGGFILLPAIVLMFLAGTVWYSRAQPLVPALQSYWLAIHVTLAATSEGALMTSAVMTVLYLLKARYDSKIKNGEPADSALSRLSERLPAAEALDKAAYRVVAFSFPLYTVGVICGAIWAEAAWGRYWGWDPKETWAFIVWVVYAGYLHARATAGWKGKSAAWINLLGFGAITFNFLVVNIVISGLHSYAGLS